VSRPEQLEDLLPATELRLDSQLRLRLDELTREYRSGDAER
jgi:hypothetical protein